LFDEDEATGVSRFRETVSDNKEPQMKINICIFAALLSFDQLIRLRCFNQIQWPDSVPSKVAVLLSGIGLVRDAIF
jgi:hypothetical protein